MRIFNKAKTHFMRKDEKGTIVKFDTIENVQTKINSILDGSNKSSNNGLFEFKTVKKLDQKQWPD